MRQRTDGFGQTEYGSKDCSSEKGAVRNDGGSEKDRSCCRRDIVGIVSALYAAVFFDIPGKMRESGMERDISRRSRDMKKAYEDEDWEQLEQYLIDECEDYIGAPDYFLYRTAWYLHTFPPQFDEAMAAHDTTEMLKVYEVLAEDYNMRRDDIFYRIYKTEDALEEALKEEVERETEILTEEGLGDEMYKLRR